MATPSFGVSRTFDVALERLWWAVTDAGELARWVLPPGARLLASRMELSVGGAFAFGVETPEGLELWGACGFLRLEPPGLLGFVHHFTDRDGRPARNPLDRAWPQRLRGECRCAVQGGGVTLTINLAPLDAAENEAAAFRRAFAMLSREFEGALDRLGARLRFSPTEPS